jgi:hypothetical protein
MAVTGYTKNERYANEGKYCVTNFVFYLRYNLVLQN